MWFNILKRRRVFTDDSGEKWPLVIRIKSEKFEFVGINEHSGFGIYQNDNERISIPLEDAWDDAKLTQIGQVDLRQPAVHISNDEIDYKEYNEETDGS